MTSQFSISPFVPPKRFKWAVGEVVWVRYSSYPYWPAIVCPEAEAEQSVLDLKRDNMLLVQFFGSPTFAWAELSSVRSFSPNFKILHEKCAEDADGRSAIVEAIKAVAAQRISSKRAEISKKISQYVFSSLLKLPTVAHRSIPLQVKPINNVAVVLILCPQVRHIEEYLRSVRRKHAIPLNEVVNGLSTSTRKPRDVIARFASFPYVAI